MPKSLTFSSHVILFLGPVLFNVFINDIFHFVQDSTIYNYADDNALSYSDTNINTVVKTLENDSINLIDWFSIFYYSK
jgi:hypothetical protein